MDNSTGGSVIGWRIDKATEVIFQRFWDADQTVLKNTQLGNCSHAKYCISDWNSVNKIENMVRALTVLILELWMQASDDIMRCGNETVIDSLTKQFDLPYDKEFDDEDSSNMVHLIEDKLGMKTVADARTLRTSNYENGLLSTDVAKQLLDNYVIARERVSELKRFQWDYEFFTEYSDLSKGDSIKGHEEIASNT